MKTILMAKINKTTIYLLKKPGASMMYSKMPNPDKRKEIPGDFPLEEPVPDEAPIEEPHI